MPNVLGILKDLNIRHYEKILDIGAYRNEAVETLRNNGYINAVGIDIDPEIEKSPFGRCINFRDLPLNDNYRVIYFNQILVHFAGEKLAKKNRPPLQLFANKIFLHLLPKGYLIFSDCANNKEKFEECLVRIGLNNICSSIEHAPNSRKPIIVPVYQKD